MNELDYLNLDGKALQLFLVVQEEGSVSRAAERLGTSQSAVSHTLDKLRAITGDPLFVRAGRGIVPTSRALALVGQVQASLDSLRALTTSDEFDPATAHQHFTVAANDFQRDFILPDFLKMVRDEAPGVTFGVIPLNFAPNSDILREDRCQLMITPHPPEASDIIQRRLLTDHYVCYYDPECRDAPSTLEAYLAAQHVEVVLAGSTHLLVDKTIHTLGLERNIFLTLPNFAGISEFIRGTDLLATLPSKLAGNSIKGIASHSLPFESPKLSMYMLWHKRYQTSPSHRWLRQTLADSCGADES
ncbi:MAG: LysR family transcriptional regulator [Gammaproteobacteria bacterium]|nr:MAG: LysR family transcriptional regulator [Gammaproteobacteria bacterium]